MIGNNKMDLNAATMIVALQYYFDKVLFQAGKAPKITDVTADMNACDGPSFLIRVEEPVKDQKEPNDPR